MFFTQNVLQGVVRKILTLKLRTVVLNLQGAAVHTVVRYKRGKMNKGKTFPDIYVLSSLPSLNTELKKHLPDNVNIFTVPTPDQSDDVPQPTIDSLRKAEVLVTDGPFLMQLLYSIPSTKWVQNSWAGVEPVIKKLDHSKPLPGFVLTRYSDTYFGESMANYVMAHIINIERRLFIYHDKQKTMEWDKPMVVPNFRVLSDLTVGVLGAGNIGAAVGRQLKNCGSRVIALVRNAREGLSEDYDQAVTDLAAVLKECDYICNVLPSTEGTRGLLDNDALRNCRKKPCFINVGRGDIIQTESLIKAINECWISGAVLDVFVDEPLPRDSPLWKMPQVHITPHIGAVTTVQGLARFSAANYLRYVNGDPLLNVVDWKIGY